MSVAEFSDPRYAAERLVINEHRRLGKLMLAYDSVARMAGTTPGWLRKFVRGYPEAKEPGWTVGLNIQSHYARLCERIEANNNAKRRKLARLEGLINAAARKSPVGQVSTLASRTTLAEDA